MAEDFAFAGTLKSHGDCSASQWITEIDAAFSEELRLERKLVTNLVLTADGPSVLDLGELTKVHVLILKTVGAKIRVRLTSADGTQQSVPVEEFFAVISKTVPFTVVDVTRVVGVETQVQVFMGEIA